MTHDDRVEAFAHELESHGLVISTSPVSVHSLQMSLRHPEDTRGILTEHAVIWQDTDKLTHLDGVWEERTLTEDNIAETAAQFARAVTPQGIRT